MKQETIFNINKDLIPVIIQDYKSGDVYMLGYMNVEALQKTMKTKRVWFWSRSKKRLWMKGEISGNILELKDIFIDCDQDTLLMKVKLLGKNVCHTKNKTCFFLSYWQKEKNNYDN